MKKLNLFLSLTVVLLFVASAVYGTGIRRGFESCQITLVDDVYFGKKIDKVWTLNYNPKEASVTVLKKKTLTGTDYVVRSKYFEVCYSATEDGFGVKKLKNNMCCVPRKITQAVIDPQAMEVQRVITPNEVDDEYAIGLIASYLPDLLNEGYTHLLN